MRSTKQSFKNNKASGKSRQWFGNHSSMHDGGHQEFEGNETEETADLVYGSTVLPTEQRQSSATNDHRDRSSS